MSDEKKLLMIAYSFPPAGGVEVNRTLKFTKYLPQLGWTPVVLTVSKGKFGKYDESAMAMVPDGLRVYRAASFELFNLGQHAGNAGKQAKRTLWSRIYSRLCLTWSYFMIPDAKVTWVPQAFLKAMRVIKKEKIKHVYISGKPFSSFLIGYLLKKFFGTSLIIDYRDPWTQNITYEKRSAFHAWLDHWLEQRIVRRSDIVIANTNINERNLANEFGAGQDRNKFVTIHNGFDREDFDIEIAGKYEKCTITYAGVFYFSVGSSFERSSGDDVMRTYSPFYFFDALERVFASRPDIKERLQVNFMGILGHGYDPIIRSQGLDGIIRRLGYLDYDEHIAVLKKSHALLMVLSTGEVSRGWVPSKFFQYLGSGNPVLALAPPGEVRNIIDKTRGGLYVEPDDVEGIANAIITLYDDYYAKGRQFERREEEVLKYERKYLASLLSRALERLS